MMEKKPSVDSGILAPIILGMLSIVGMAVVYFFWRANAMRPVGEANPTRTPFRYVYLGTEPGLSTLTPAPTNTAFVLEPPTLTDTPDFFGPPIVSLTPTSPNSGAATQPIPRTPNPTATPTILSVLAKYDDTHFAILYDGDWVSQSNVTGAHQNTLHISFTVENYAMFTFVGQQVIVGYQAGPSLGRVLIDLDGLEFEVDQSSGATQLAEWRSPVLVMGTHEIIIEHLSGGSVNLDSITIPDLNTPTPTATP
ncbi:MAG: hypothetical protein HUU11_00920 [Anaerolineales bacterium]|nr:hypothetical protein [Anaerolineales bacterium]